MLSPVNENETTEASGQLGILDVIQRTDRIRADLRVKSTNRQHKTFTVLRAQTTVNTSRNTQAT
jgi:hypothetical protein